MEWGGEGWERAPRPPTNVCARLPAIGPHTAYKHADPPMVCATKGERVGRGGGCREGWLWVKRGLDDVAGPLCGSAVASVVHPARRWTAVPTTKLLPRCGATLELSEWRAVGSR